MSSRHQARELALQILFQVQFSKKVNYVESLNLYRGDHKINEDDFKYAESLISGVIEHRDQLDGLIEGFLKNWKLDRLSLVDLNVLRIAVFEIQNLQLDAKVAINEAVEIAKKYGTTDSGSFVNGVLDQIARDQFNAL